MFTLFLFFVFKFRMEIILFNAIKMQNHWSLARQSFRGESYLMQIDSGMAVNILLRLVNDFVWNFLFYLCTEGHRPLNIQL